jgi:hypothetical protein
MLLRDLRAGAMFAFERLTGKAAEAVVGRG